MILLGFFYFYMWEGNGMGDGREIMFLMIANVLMRYILNIC